MSQFQRMTSGRIWAARGVALAADAIQLVLFPFFAGGAPEGFDLVLDLVTAGVLSWLCGFHVAFLPTVVAEAVPVLDLFPTWTAAALYVTRKGAQQSEDQAIVDGARARLEANEARQAAKQIPGGATGQ